MYFCSYKSPDINKYGIFSLTISIKHHLIMNNKFAIAIVAALSIVGSVVMLLTDKQRDIATLRAMGADSSLIRNIFVGEGILLTILGTAIGAILGVALSLGQEYYGWGGMPNGGAIIESYPVDLRAGDTLLVVAIFLIIGIAVSRLTVAHTLRKKRL